MAMEKKYLIINLGSASKKYSLYSENSELANINVNHNTKIAKINIKNKFVENKISNKQFDNFIEYLIQLFISEKLILSKNDLTSIAIRIVAPGSYFLKNRIIDSVYIKKLKTANKIFPLHISLVLNELSEIKKVLPKVLVIGISDSAFHNLPANSKLYSIPKIIASKFDIYRFGYHGLSISSILSKLKSTKGYISDKIIICHLGGGSSITAIKNGKSIDTSMGFTPLEGLPGSTRIGNIDASAVIYLAKKFKNINVLEKYLNFNCGLLGLSGESLDMKELLELESRGDINARLAIENYVYNIRKYLGSYILALNGLDVLVFTGGIGENSSIIRSKICSELELLGIKLDEHENNKNNLNISFSKSKVNILVLPSDESKEMHSELLKF